MKDDKLVHDFEEAIKLFRQAKRRIERGQKLLKQFSEIFHIETSSLDETISRMEALVKASEDELEGDEDNLPERQDALRLLKDAKESLIAADDMYQSAVRNTKLAAELLKYRAVMPDKLKLNDELVFIKNLMNIAKGLPPWYTLKNEKKDNERGND